MGAVAVVVAGIALVDVRMIAALQELWKRRCKCGTSRLIIHMVTRSYNKAWLIFSCLFMVT